MPITRIATNAPWEPIVGYARVVRAGNVVHVSGTTATGDDGAVVGIGDTYAQAKRTIENIARALALAGATLADVVRTRIYVTDIDQWESVARAHREAFGAHPPATAMVEVSRLVSPDMLVEIEAEAVIEDR